MFNISKQAYHTHNRSWIDSFAFRFIIKADIAAGNRGLQGFAGPAHAYYCLVELPGYLRFFRVAKV